MAKKILELAKAEFDTLLNDYYAEPQHRSQLTPEELQALAERLNRKIDIPIIKETGEEKILIKIILKIDNFLYENLPNEFYDLVRSAEKGIDEEEAKMMVTRLTKLANKKINLPFLSEKAEEKIIRFVIDLIVKSSIKKHNLQETLKNSE
jgi:hypothetical protein